MQVWSSLSPRGIVVIFLCEGQKFQAINQKNKNKKNEARKHAHAQPHQRERES